ncbi:MAG: molybdenum cofactor guanylyltransferase, partial [archaeon]|nr:molybdenum cofactor guanylyltransferase [archaeon]
MNENSKKSYSCIVLSGGASRRMGKDKGSMIIQNKPMIFHILNKLNYKINDAVIVLNNSERVAMYEDLLNQYSKDTIYNEFDYEISFAIDEIEDKGPLCGIMTGLKHIKTDYAIVLPCDSPYIEETYIENMFNLLENNNFPDAIIPFNSSLNHEKDILNQNQENNIDIMTDTKADIKTDITCDEVKIKQSEPLHSIYSKKSLLLIEDLLKNDDLFVKSFIRKLSDVYFVLIDDDLIKEINFKNIN